MRTQPQRYWVAQARARNKKGRWEYWHLVNNRPLTAFTMAHEYAQRFGCEEGFRDAKHALWVLRRPGLPRLRRGHGGLHWWRPPCSS